ncbi:MAG: hypothetical protein V1487_00370 [bacterium]
MKKDLLIITLVFAFLSSAFFLFAKTTRGGMSSVFKAWDGPSYVIAAQSLYVPEDAVRYNSIQSKDIRANFTFLPAHFPLYPLFIRSFSFIGYYQSMLMFSLVFSLAFLLAFYLLSRELHLFNPLLLTLPMILLPPRWFIVSHTGSSEPLFLFLVISSLLFYFRHSPWSSAALAALAMLTRPQGALLGLTYLVIASIDLYRSKSLRLTLNRYSPYLLVPLALLGVFCFYLRQAGDFWAFFSAISIFHHFKLTIFPTFNYGAPNIETFWQEASVLYYFLYLVSIIRLFSRKTWQLGVLGIIFYLPLIFLQHEDISRYALPLMPLAFIAFSKVASTRSFSLAALLSSPAIFLYTTNFILHNRAL